MFCVACGKEITQGTKICPFCLAPQERPTDLAVPPTDAVGSKQTEAPASDDAAVMRSESRSGASLSGGDTVSPHSSAFEQQIFANGGQAGATASADNPLGGAAGAQEGPYQQYRQQPQNVCDPALDRPLGSWAFVGYSLLFMIPFAGFILQIVFSCIDCNKNLQHFARSRLLLAAIGFVCFILFGLLIFYFISSVWNASGMWEASDMRDLTEMLEMIRDELA